MWFLFGVFFLGWNSECALQHRIWIGHHPAVHPRGVWSVPGARLGSPVGKPSCFCFYSLAFSITVHSNGVDMKPSGETFIESFRSV